MKFLCKIGWHKYYKREVHVEAPLDSKTPVFQASIIERCKCGAGRSFLFNGGIKPTTIHIPLQYKYDISSDKFLKKVNGK